MPASAPRVGIAGLGLVGASLGLALREQGLDVVGLDSDARVAQRALQRGVVAGNPGGLEEVSQQVDVLFLCAPPRANRMLLEQLVASDTGRPLLVADVGSVKGPIVRRAAALLVGRAALRFVGTHPMAGSEAGGQDAASATLFRGRPWILTSPEADAAPLPGMLRAIGARIHVVSPEAHDRTVAHLSHAVQLLAYECAGMWREAGLDLELAGPAALEVLRLSRSPAELWEEILEENRAEVSPALEQLAAALQRRSRATEGSWTS